MKKIIFMILLFPALCFGGIGLYGNPTPVVIHKGTNAPVLIKLYDTDNSLLTSAEIAAITKIEVYYRSDSGATPETTDSITYAAGFDKTTYAARGEIMLKIGLVDFAAGRDRQAELIIYNATYTSGRVIGLLDMQVSSDVEDGAEMVDALTGQSYKFKTITVAGQPSIVADSNTDTLTLVAGTNITLTTNATADSVTITAGGGGTGDMLEANYDTESEFESNLFAIVTPGELDYYTDADIDGTESAFAGWDKDSSNDVATLGNQTIGGVKTFSSSPIVPAPTTDMQAATKKYVDDNAGTGDGDVVGPASATDGNLAVFDLTTGKLIKDGGAPFAWDYDFGDLINVPAYLLAEADPTVDLTKLQSLVTNDFHNLGGTDATGPTYSFGTGLSEAGDHVICTVVDTNTTYASSDFEIANLTDAGGLRSIWSGKVSFPGFTSLSGDYNFGTVDINADGTIINDSHTHGSSTITEADPTVDTSAEIQAIIGSGVYEPAFDFGTGAGDVNTDDIPAGSVNLYERDTGTNTGNETAASIEDIMTGADAATTPVDADTMSSVVSGVLKKITWANIKATLKTYFDTLYAAALGADDNYVTDAEKTALHADESSATATVEGIAHLGETPSGATVPTSPATGDKFILTATGRVLEIMWDGSVWQPVKQYGAATYYVSSTGTNDFNHGTATGTDAFLTVQYAISLASCKKTVGAIATINVAAGTYAESCASYGGDIVISGSLTELESISSAALVAGGTITQGTVTKAGAFAGNSYSKKLVYFAIDAEYRMIDTHTDDVLTLVGEAPSGTTQNIVVYDWGTIIDPSAGIGVHVYPTEGDVTLQNLKIDRGAGEPCPVQIEGFQRTNMIRCWTMGYVNNYIQSRNNVSTSLINGDGEEYAMTFKQSAGFVQYSYITGGTTAALSSSNMGTCFLRDGNIIDTTVYGISALSVGQFNTRCPNAYNRIRNASVGVEVESGSAIIHDDYNVIEGSVTTAKQIVYDADMLASYQAVENGATLPDNPSTGQFFIQNVTGRKLRFQYDGASWIPDKAFGNITVYVDSVNGTDDMSHGTATGTDAFETITYALEVAQVAKPATAISYIYVASGAPAENVVISGENITLIGTLTELETSAAITVSKGGDTTRGYVDDGAGGCWSGDDYSKKLLYLVTDATYRIVDGHAKTITINSGGTNDIVAGDVIAGATSGAYADVLKTTNASGTWAGGDWTGTLTIYVTSGTWQNGENVDNKTDANLNVATTTSTVAADNNILVFSGQSLSTTTQDVKIYDWGTTITPASGIGLNVTGKNVIVQNLKILRGSGSINFQFNTNATGTVYGCSSVGYANIIGKSNVDFYYTVFNGSGVSQSLTYNQGSGFIRQSYIYNDGTDYALVATNNSTVVIRDGSIIENAVYGASSQNSSIVNATSTLGYSRVRNCTNGLISTVASIITPSANTVLVGNVTTQKTPAAASDPAYVN